MDMQIDFFETSNSVLQELTINSFNGRGIKIFVKRDDLIHEDVSGNKWRKLKFNIQQIIQNNHAGFFTFGGAFSNHLIAAASAANKLGISCIGFVRGEELNSKSNETLQKCSELGMRLIFLSREEYGMRNDKQYIDELKTDFPNYYFIPEGGANFLGMVGCQEIWKELPQDLDHVFVAQGTTATSCGLLLGTPKDCKLHVIPVLKGFDANQTMLQFLNSAFYNDEFPNELMEKVVVHDAYHFGGYGKYSKELLEFIQQIYKEYQLPLDPVYTGKAFYGMMRALESPIFDGKKILFIHTGGLQGCKSIEQKEEIELHPK